MRIAVIGSGIAGAACAHALGLAEHAVHVFEKSRGPGGRLATRRVEWTDRRGLACTTPLDHGAIAITARSAAFQTFVRQAVETGWLAPWAPRWGPGLGPVEDGDPLYLPVPDLPTLCRRLLNDAMVTGSFTVDRLHRCPLGWQVEAAGERHPLTFDAVVLALPPGQAAPLLGPHRADWARHASVVPMQPCWTLMGIAESSRGAPDAGPDWDLARPSSGPLAWVSRNDARPARARVTGQAHWVVHARAGWSRRNLEEPAAWVQQQLQAALACTLGRPVDWQHSLVHRWRYALPPAQRVAEGPPCWWDAALGLGVCGDFFGGTGVEGAWLSAGSLSSTVSASLSAPPTPRMPGAPRQSSGRKADRTPAEAAQPAALP